MNASSRFAPLIMCAVLLVSGCSRMLQGKQASDTAVAEFHKMYNEGKIPEIRAVADPKFRSAASAEEFSQLMGALQRKLGKVQGSSTTSINIRNFNLTTTIVLRQATTFESGTGTETFTFEMGGDKARLVGYDISSKELITR